jgi:hypothetical protein
VIPNRIFQSMWYSVKKVWPDFVHWKIAISIWKECSTSLKKKTSLSMEPSATRFQHHFKLRSVYIINTIVFFSDHGIFWSECLYIYNYLEYFPSRKCIISLKRVHYSLRQSNLISKFQDGVLLRI